MAETRPLPLAGVRVLDFGHILAGPFCARLLVDLGADVIKVETASRQGSRRGAQVMKNGAPVVLSDINRNRRSIDLDLKSDIGRDIAKRLAAEADVLVENFSSGVMDRLGLGYDVLAAANPRLIYASMSAFGHTGPHKDWTGMNVTLQACSGMMLATGAEGDAPTGISNSWNDYVGGLHTAVAIVGALHERRTTGLGRNLNMAQFEGSAGMIGSLVLYGAITGKAAPRIGNRSDIAAPQGVYRCAGDDQWCAISIQTDVQWTRLLDLLGDGADALRRAGLNTLAGRIQHHDEIDAVLESWTREITPTQAEDRLAAIGAPAAAMRRGNEIGAVAEWREVLRPIENEGGFDWQVPGLPFSFGETKPVTPICTPAPGTHSDEVLRDWLGIDDPASIGLVRSKAAK